MGATPNDIAKTALSAKQRIAWKLLEHSPTVTEVLYGGAAGGGKSWFGCLWQIFRRVAYPGTRGAIGRSELKNLKRTTLKTFNDIWEEYGQFNPAGVTMHFDAQSNIYKFSNGSEIICIDLFEYPSDPDFKSLGSLEITDAFIDEVTEITEKAFQIFSSRIRYRLDRLRVAEPKILITGNPASNWVKWNYIKNQKGNPATLRPHQAVIQALLTDNPDAEFRRVYGKQLENTLNEYDLARLLGGDWDAEPPTGGEFYTGFDRKRNIATCRISSTLPAVHLSFDQNVIPYNSCLCAQIDTTAGVKRLIFFDEITLPPPQNTTEHVCQEFSNRHGHNTQAVFYYGDASGRSRSTRTEENDYQIVHRKLQKWVVYASDRTAFSNPPLTKRRDFTNKILAGQIQGVEVVIDPGCHNFISDLTRCKTDANGGKLKNTERDPRTGATYQPNGHLGDCFEYFLVGVLKTEWELFLQGR
jgi:phage terminase large subunit